MNDQALHQFFAYAPWVIFAVIITVAYFSTRPSSSRHEPARNAATYACVNCGRRGGLDQMVTVNREGATAWYCPSCFQNRS
jgi:predicted RNA-binding Zn-ribbon protein involved in translation (DUF1610 family)